MFIEVNHISKSFAGEHVLENVSFNLEAGKTLSVLGKSGCGKTTLLRVLAGQLVPDAGAFSIEGKSVLGLLPRERGVVYISQQPLLFPHLNVFENIAFGLRLRKMNTRDIEKRVHAMLEQLGLVAEAKKMPGELSGGQKQRVAFGRALVINPRVLLLDEPFGSLDAQNRAVMQELFHKVKNTFKITALFVTHDLREALVVGDEIARLANGELKQYATRQAFIDDPESGVHAEQEFWTNLNNLKNGNKRF